MPSLLRTKPKTPFRAGQVGAKRWGGSWIRRWRKRNHRRHIVQNQLRNEGLIVDSDYGVLRPSSRRYAFVVIAEEKAFILPSLGYSGPGEVEVIWRTALAANQSNLEAMIGRALTAEFDRRNFATKGDLEPFAKKADLEPLATKQDVQAVEAKVAAVSSDLVSLSTRVGDLATFVKSRL